MLYRMMHIPFKNRYIELGEKFYARTQPTSVARPKLIKFNDELAASLGISGAPFNESEYADMFSGNVPPHNAEPLAMVYSGHQFGQFNPQLGDGRAILLGELIGLNNQSFSIQLKGSGPTLYSRNGDGRSALGPVLREYLLSEAMEKLGVPTTRALAAVTSGEDVIRETTLPGGVFTRVASSFIRVGSFQYFAAHDDVPAIKKLADYVIDAHYPDAREKDNPYLAFLEAVVEGQASLIAKWMQLGFIHGVMNTDNMSVTCETIDYGPCAFMDDFDPDKVFSYIDHHGRYAYSNQPTIGLWNLTRLAESLVPLLAPDTNQAVEQAKSVLQTFGARYEKHWLEGMQKKCGLVKINEPILNEDKALIENLLAIMADSHTDFTLTFYYLSQLTQKPTECDDKFKNLFNNSVQCNDWILKWRDRINIQNLDDHDRQQLMQASNPIYIPRNHQVEKAIRAAEDHNDFSVFHELYDVLQTPYIKQTGKDDYMQAPNDDELVRQTFCGT